MNRGLLRIHYDPLCLMIVILRCQLHFDLLDSTSVDPSEFLTKRDS